MLVRNIHYTGLESYYVICDSGNYNVQAYERLWNKLSTLSTSVYVYLHTKPSWDYYVLIIFIALLIVLIIPRKDSGVGDVAVVVRMGLFVSLIQKWRFILGTKGGKKKNISVLTNRRRKKTKGNYAYQSTTCVLCTMISETAAYQQPQLAQHLADRLYTENTAIF